MGVNIRGVKGAKLLLIWEFQGCEQSKLTIRLHEQSEALQKSCDFELSVTHKV